MRNPLDLQPFEDHRSWEQRLRQAFKEILPTAFTDPVSGIRMAAQELRDSPRLDDPEDICTVLTRYGLGETSPSLNGIYLVDVMNDLGRDEEHGGCGLSHEDFVALTEELVHEMAREEVVSL